MKDMFSGAYPFLNAGMYPLPLRPGGDIRYTPLQKRPSGSRPQLLIFTKV